MRSAPVREQLPAVARGFLADGNTELIYNPYATATWRTVRAPDVFYLKAAWVGSYPSLSDERDRCLWLSGRGVPVPAVIDQGSDGEVEWLITAARSGTPATVADRVRDPRRLVPALAEGLRAFHAVDLPVAPSTTVFLTPLRTLARASPALLSMLPGSMMFTST